MKTKTVELRAKFSRKTVKIRVPEAAIEPYHITPQKERELRTKAKLVTGDYFVNVSVGY